MLGRWHLVDDEDVRYLLSLHSRKTTTKKEMDNSLFMFLLRIILKW